MSIDFLHSQKSTIESDEVYTPSNALAPLLPYLNKDSVIYEATSGVSSHLLNHLKDAGLNAKGSFGRDFFDYDNRYDIVVTNPPYSIKFEFIEKCFKLGKPFALLLPLASLQGVRSHKILKDKQFEVMILNKRLKFVGAKTSAPFGSIWLCSGVLPQKLILGEV